MKKLDLRSFQCPHPVVETRKLMLETPGTVLQILVGDSMARENVSRMADSQGYRVTVDEHGEGFALTLSPSGEAGGEAATLPTTGKTVLFCNSDQMGSGEEELGRLLLKNYLFTLTEMETVPDSILFVNSGVRLACSGSEALEALEQLACQGVDIASCGLCLDFYQLKDRLQVGRVTNMLEIAETQQNAGRIIKP